ncbi:MAG: polysaccharide deacetylase family protein [Gammaproteobacteria bacterium]
MNRNTVGVVGAAGSIAQSLRALVETLARRLSLAGYDLVTGGEDGVMRAVARGHFLAGSASKLIHVQPGWEGAWKRNPYPAALADTGLGMMRDHLVVRAADVVIAVAGGSGTLNEMSIAWMEQKPIASLSGEGGWSERLAGTRLDRRSNRAIESWATVDEAVTWVQRMRPHGVFAGGLNRGFYPLSVCALHRVRGTAQNDCAAHDIHAKFGMSINWADCVTRLTAFNSEVAEWNGRHCANSAGLATFDDGWKDVMGLIPVFRDCPNLCPVLFIGENHYADPIRPLPLQRLYQGFAQRKRGASTLENLTAMRARLKELPESAQHRLLDAEGVASMPNPEWLLTPDDLRRLRAEGWVVASHGPAHEDLRQHSGLAELLQKTADAIEARRQMPWLAWPEGKWSPDAVKAASAAGYTLQFGLREEPHPAPPAGMVMRSLWQ